MLGPLRGFIRAQRAAGNLSSEPSGQRGSKKYVGVFAGISGFAADPAPCHPVEPSFPVSARSLSSALATLTIKPCSQHFARSLARAPGCSGPLAMHLWGVGWSRICESRSYPTRCSSSPRIDAGVPAYLRFQHPSVPIESQPFVRTTCPFPGPGHPK